MRWTWATLLIFIASGVSLGQGNDSTKLLPTRHFPMEDRGPVLRQAVRSGEPFTVAGPQGTVLGEQRGIFEAWILPVKLLSQFTIEAEVADYPVPIDVNAAAREIEVWPDRTVITYSHIAFTLRQTMFAPDAMAGGTGAVVLFEVDSVRPVDLTFRFTGEMRKMWPEPGGGSPSAEWTPDRGGFYVLHTDFPDFAGAVALPGARPGIMAPYQERPQLHPLELKLHVDPKTDRGKVYPLLLAVGQTPATATRAALGATLAVLDANLPQLYARHAQRYSALRAAVTCIETPDAALNTDVTWAEMAIEQLRAKAQPTGEIGLVAGYYASGDSARPGFGWFFGRDTLYTLYAIDSYGDFALARQALSFLMARQRADGKVMHEYSQTAAFVDWKDLPYEYAAADGTPLFLTAMLDYVRASGDVVFLREHREAVMRAWRFETTHDADGDGIYDNAEGTGWVESWPPGMPKQEVYLALLDQQGSAAMGQLAALLGDQATSAAARSRSIRVRETIEREYYLPAMDRYAFSRGNVGRPADAMDTTETLFPAIAWWNAGPGYEPGLQHPAASLGRWASEAFATDWGLRDVAASDPLYDPMSYHQGSVWPLFTGWAAIAQYRSGHALAGYLSTMQNAKLTTAQDLGAVTELLSGDFFAPFGRSTSHQLWSSAMVVTPVLRGLFGLQLDATEHTVRVQPHLPGDWNSAAIRHVHVGQSVVDLLYRRSGTAMTVSLEMRSGPIIRLAGTADGQTLRLPLPAVEVSLPSALPLPGARTEQVKVLDEAQGARSLQLQLAGQGGTVVHFKVRRNTGGLALVAIGATLSGGSAGEDLAVSFAPGEGYVRQTVALRW